MKLMFGCGLLASACVGVLSLIAQPGAPISESVVAVMQKFSKDAFRAHMAFLADDLLEGRAAGARGHEIAARYIAAQFEAIGLQPAGDKGTFYQRIPLREITVEPSSCSATLVEDKVPNALKWGDDFIMNGLPWNPDATVEAPVVFAGYGVTSPDGKYDDYAGIDAKGKIVATFSGAPSALSPELRAHLSSGREKSRIADEHGAIGILTLRPPEMDRILPWQRVVQSVVFPSMRWIGGDGQPNDSRPNLRAAAILS